ncbi:MAG: FecR domain-containing protein [Spirochaetes bacterium]|nr:FecR domain-containing protein [Spirochaetota bacterium]
MKFSLSDIFIVGVSTAVISAFSYLYYKDITAKVEAGTAEEVGTLVYKRKVTERKFSGQVVWEDIEDEIPVYNNDSIRTSDLSEAVIRLHDGTEIKLNENSMILLALGDNQIDIEFARGSILASRNNAEGDVKALNIKSGTTNVTIDKSNVELSQSKTGDLSLKVAKGNANLNTGKGIEKVGTDKQLVISKNADVLSFDLGLKLITPLQDSYHATVADKTRIAFSWEDVKGEHDVFFELSDGMPFTNILNSTKVENNNFSLDMSKGIYYWRVRAVHKVSKKQEFSEARRFTVLWDQPVYPVSPENREIIKYRTKLPIINFKWTKSEIASGYKLILASDSELNNIIGTYQIQNNNYVIDSLDKGAYFWRIEKITGLKDITDTVPSIIYRFDLQEKEMISAPELVYPVNRKQFSRIMLDKKNITFTWNQNPDIREYKFDLAMDRRFDNIIHTAQSKLNFYQLAENLSKGEYFWRVTGLIEQDEFTSPSVASVFSIVDKNEIKLFLPQNNAVLSPQENEKLASVRFSWERSVINGNYKLEISKNKNFSSIYKESALSSITNAATIDEFKPGEYFWKVKLLDEENNLILESKSRSITVKEVLGNPDIVSPKNGYDVNMSNKDELSLVWKNVNGADFYRMTLYRLKQGKKYKIAYSEQKGTSYKITDLRKLDTGSFQWTLQAFEGRDNTITRKSSVIESDFKITLGKPMQKADVDNLKIENL